MMQAICWTLVHSLWQGLFFALIAGGVMLLTRRASAAVRYNLVCIIFFLFLAVCAATFLYELAGALPEEDTVVAVVDSGSRMAAWIDALGKYCSEHAVLIVWGWLFVFTIKSLHMLGSYLYIQRVRHYGIGAAPGDWQERVNMLCRQMGIQRTVRLVESQIVKMPMVIGHLRPMILMPLGLITGLPQEEIEAVLLHELAHIRRNDYVVNFIQNVAVNIFFFNPGLLWMSSLLREERENCCDDIAIARTRDRAGFIRALISFKEHDLRLAGVANAFPGKKNQLVKRAMRIAESSNKTLDPVEKIFLTISLILISALVAATSGSSSSSPVKMAQIPGGKYRVFVDTPTKPMQAAVLQNPQKEEKPPMVHKEKPGPEIKNRQDATPEETAMTDESRQKLKNIAAMEDEVQAKKMIVDAKTAQEDEQILKEKKLADDAAVQAIRDREQAVRDKAQAQRDAEQAVRDKRQAELDKKQAERDAQQALLDKIQAERDAHRALLDRAQHTSP